MSSSICPRFSQNAWKKDLCSNCFKSKEEHKRPEIDEIKLLQKVNLNAEVPKGIIKKSPTKRKNRRVSFPNELTQVIGYGGEWSDTEQSDTDDIPDIQVNNQKSKGGPNNTTDGIIKQPEDDVELEVLTKVNTDFNTNNKNLSSDDPEAIKKVTEATKRIVSAKGKLDKSSNNRKQTLQIQITPFGGPAANNKVYDLKQKFNYMAPQIDTKESTTKPPVVLKTIIKTTGVEYVEQSINNCGMENGNKEKEKSLLEEISETLNSSELMSTAAPMSDHVTTTEVEQQTDSNISELQQFEATDKLANGRLYENHYSKKLIQRTAPITKDHAKPKIQVFPKFNDADSLSSDQENGNSEYYDVVEASNSYENIPDGYMNTELNNPKQMLFNQMKHNNQGQLMNPNVNDKITENNLRQSTEQNYSNVCLTDKSNVDGRIKQYSFTSQITSDGLILAKPANSDDAMDSNGSSFDYATSSDDDDLSMNRSESDSGIGICINNIEYNGKLQKVMTKEHLSSDYEDIQVVETDNSSSQQHQHHHQQQQQQHQKDSFALNKSRELAGEPDGSADPDGNAIKESNTDETKVMSITATLTAGGTGCSNMTKEKPSIPTKPIINTVKLFTKRQPNTLEQQVITQLQQVIKPQQDINDSIQIERPSSLIKSQPNDIELTKSLKKRAPNPPPPTLQSIDAKIKQFNSINKSTESLLMKDKDSITDCLQHQSYSFLYTKNPTGSVKSSLSPVIREKDKRERATVNPKFRSLNTFSTHYKNQRKERSTTPEPAPRKISLSQENLLDDKKKKSKFSIKKFLRIGTNKSLEDSDTNNLKRCELNETETKPRLVIIHPLDMNKTELEIVKDAGNVTCSTIDNPLGKPPVPPIRRNADENLQEEEIPTRPPPPKCTELKQKQQKMTSTLENQRRSNGTMNREDTIYANLGEIRSAIAPRKPERTASMREQEALQELARKRVMIKQRDDNDCDADDGPSDANFINNIDNDKSNEETDCKNKTRDDHQVRSDEQQQQYDDTKLYGRRVSTTLELFERTIAESKQPPKSLLNDGIKNSMQKMSNTIDSYLKDKLADSESINGGNTTATSIGVSVATTVALAAVAQQEKLMPTESSVSPVTTSSSGSIGDRKSDTKTSSDVEIRPQQTNAYEPLQMNSTSSSGGHSIRASMPDPSSLYMGGKVTTNSEYASTSTLNTGHKLQSQSLVNIVRAVSRSYCGSEISESDIYSPYSFYGSEAGGDVAIGDLHHDTWGLAQQPVKRPNRLRLRRGRSILHKNLEDNYGAVIVANHEALAQVLEQLQKSATVPLALRPLANLINLQFDDFKVLEGRAVVAGRRAFHQAIWANQLYVTIVLSTECNQVAGIGNEFTGSVSAVLSPITEFCDLVPNHYLPLMPSTEVKKLQATITVLPRMHIETMESFGNFLKTRTDNLKQHVFTGSTLNLANPSPISSRKNVTGSVQNLSSYCDVIDENEITRSNVPGVYAFDDMVGREVGFVMLQLVNALKNLQSKGIEELPLSLSNVILCRDLENKDTQPKLCILQGFNQDLTKDDDEQFGTLCECAHHALTKLLPTTKLTKILADVLNQNRSESLSKSKSLLEFVLWGPSDVELNGTSREREMAIQRWLDLERATLLHGLVRVRSDLSAYDECHLMFLVRSNSKIISEASLLLSNLSSKELKDN